MGKRLFVGRRRKTGRRRSRREEPAATSDAVASAAGVDALLASVAEGGLPEVKPPAPPPRRGGPRRARSARVPLERYVSLWKNGRKFRALARDISESGIFLEALPLPAVKAGDRVTVEIDLEDRAVTVRATGEAVRDGESRGFHSTAITFTEVDEAGREAIREYVAERARFVE